MPSFTVEDMIAQAKKDQKAHHTKWGRGPSNSQVAAIKGAARKRESNNAAALRVQIADLISQGMNNADIARKLRRSKDTIQYHAKPIREAIDARRRESE